MPAADPQPSHWVKSVQEGQGRIRLARDPAPWLACHMLALFIHGVPDTPAMWRPLIEALDLADGEAVAPALPGFGCALPPGFRPTKDTYAAWLIAEAEQAVARHGGPVHLVGHDWGALLSLRAASLRPDLFASWAVSDAVIDPAYRGHRMAKLWATPIVGEVVMWLARKPALAKALADQGLPEELARHEADAFDATMRSSILTLYRSAVGLRFSGPWVEDLARLPANGLVIWGETDPYVPLETAQRFCTKRAVPLHVEQDAGHWALVERPQEVAARLRRHWNAA